LNVYLYYIGSDFYKGHDMWCILQNTNFKIL